MKQELNQNAPDLTGPSPEETDMLAEMITYGIGQTAYRKQGFEPGRAGTNYLQRTLDQNLIEDPDPNADFPNIDDGPAMVANMERLLASKEACQALNAYADAAAASTPNEYDLRDLAEEAIRQTLANPSNAR